MKKRLKRIEKKLDWQNKALTFLLEQSANKEAFTGGEAPEEDDDAPA